jgi:hypothetical protein
MSGIVWGNHRYTNRRIDNLNSAVGKDVSNLKKNVNTEFGIVKEHVSDCEKGTLLEVAAAKKEFRCSIEKVVDKLEELIKAGHEAIFDELKYLRRKGGE